MPENSASSFQSMWRIWKLSPNYLSRKTVNCSSSECRLYLKFPLTKSQKTLATILIERVNKTSINSLFNYNIMESEGFTFKENRDRIFMVRMRNYGDFDYI